MFFYILCVFLLYFLRLGRGSQRLRPSPERTCNAGIRLDRRHGSLGDPGLRELHVISFGFDGHDLWLGMLLKLGLLSMSFDLSLPLSENGDQSVALGMNLNLGGSAFV